MRRQTTRNSNADRRPQRLGAIRTDWTLDEARAIHALPFNDLLFQAQARAPAALRSEPRADQHAAVDQDRRLPEDCAYCPQSVRYETGLVRDELMESRTSSRRRARRSVPARRGSAWAPRTGTRSRASSR
jgi:biotin synthase